MNCSEAAEYVSALFDGEPLSREAAAHLSDCEECRTRLNDYAEMGAELRDVASASWPQPAQQGQWKLAEPAPARDWLRKWRGTMRIPRFAFVLMLLALLALSLSTGLSLTRGTGTNGWFAYDVLGRDGKRIMSGAVPPNGEGNPYYDAGAGMTYADGMVCFHFRMMERMGEVEKIGVKGLWVPKGSSRGFCVGLDNMQEREFLYSPGEELEIPVDGFGDLGIKGKFESKLPENVERGMYPQYGKFRIDAPVLLVRGKEVLGRFNGGGGELSLGGAYFAYGQQNQGWFLFSSQPIAGAVEGTLTMNQIEFSLDGKAYSLFTGDPIVFGRIKVWVKHYASIKDADPTSSGENWSAENPALAFGELRNLAVEK